ncbi:KpsF/GutQ family sugar-phosphate isomerase [Planctomicrobium sp. SH661]|uniref:KpsF/GutQ family sugar-phosphate isomerase n=1 Tax=Planctomicrobium sp. SH661 TaxID=3448124 RepID=UPI003F5CA9FC
MSAAERLIPFSQFERLRAGREIVRQEAEALLEVVKRLDSGFCLAVQSVLDCSGSVIVCGMGKAGLIGQKIAATLSSTGTRAHFLHPGEAVHGDLGCLHADDILLALSNSGETEELLSILSTVKSMGVKVISITATDQNSLACKSDVVVEIGRLREACPWGLAPSTSTTAMLAVGDALALVVSQARGFGPQNFARFHPGGSLGQKLKPVVEVMRPRDQLRIAPATSTVREVFTMAARPGRRSGAVLLVDEEDSLAGIFTDSDLARLLEARNDKGLDEPIVNVMTSNPLTVRSTAVLADVIDLLAERKISELPVVDDQRRPLGLIDITDVIGWLPTDSGE